MHAFWCDSKLGENFLYTIETVSWLICLEGFERWVMGKAVDDLASTSACFVPPSPTRCMFSITTFNTNISFRLCTILPALRRIALTTPSLLRLQPFCPTLTYIHSSLWKLCISCTSRILLLLPLSLNRSSKKKVWGSFKLQVFQNTGGASIELWSAKQDLTLFVSYFR